MELHFSKNLTKYRKRRGLTQGQLARKLNVTPQAVSKWENGSLPDSEFLPHIAQILGISIDVLFGLKPEMPEPDLEQSIADKIRHTPEPERADVMMQLVYAAFTAYHDYKISKQTYPENLELETYAELRTDYECALARLNEDMKYMCFVKTPENGVDSYTAPTEGMLHLFRTLADEDAITLIHYLGSSHRNRMQSLDFITAQVGLPREKVAMLMDNFDRLGLVWRVSADIADTPSIIYGYGYNTPLVCLLVIAKSLAQYIRFHDLFVDNYTRGPFRSNAARENKPVPQVSNWSEQENFKEELS